MARGVCINIGLNELENNVYKLFTDISKSIGFTTLNSSKRNAASMFELVQKTNQVFEMVDNGFNFPLFAGKPKAEDVKNTIRSYSNPKGNPLKEGDFLIITFSGHGMVLPDNIGKEPITKDNKVISKNVAWCLYDRPLLDDEIVDLLSDFEKGIRILVISDSCSSGSVIDFYNAGVDKPLKKKLIDQGFNFEVFESAVLKAKGFDFIKYDEKALFNNIEIINHIEIQNQIKTNLQRIQLEKFKNDFKNSLFNISSTKIEEFINSLDNSKLKPKANFFNELNKFGKTVKISKSNLKKLPKFELLNLDQNLIFDINSLSEIPLINGFQQVPKAIALAIYENKRKEFDGERLKATRNICQKMTKGEDIYKASIISLSACGDVETDDDDATTLDGCDTDVNGEYTSSIKEIWNDGKFEGTYESFQKQLETGFALKGMEKVKYCKFPDTLLHKQIPRIGTANVGDFINKPPFRLNYE